MEFQQTCPSSCALSSSTCALCHPLAQELGKATTLAKIQGRQVFLLDFRFLLCKTDTIILSQDFWVSSPGPQCRCSINISLSPSGSCQGQGSLPCIKTFSFRKGFPGSTKTHIPDKSLPQACLTLILLTLRSQAQDSAPLAQPSRRDPAWAAGRQSGISSL